MVEIERTSDPVRLSYLRAVLDAAAVGSFVLGGDVGGLWPGALPTRLMVAEADAGAARQALAKADPREVWR